MKRVRTIEFGDRTTPLCQKLLRAPKGQPTQTRWIILACRDKEFDLAVIEELDGEGNFQVDRVRARPYSELWDVLRDARLSDRKYWAIGWRMHYAMDRADFTQALEDGVVELPHVHKGRSKGKHTGKLTYNKQIFEVDIVVGRNKVKMLDWCNFGIAAFPDSSRLNEISLELCGNTLSTFLGMADALGVQVCKPTSAQLGWYHARRIADYSTLHVNLDTGTRALERRAYHGGRNECFRLGDIPGTTYSLDVKSCYAAICAEELLPCSCIEEYRAGCDVAVINANWVDHWIADVVLKTDVPDYPLRWKGTPIYPVGEFATALAWPELRLAIERGHVVTILNARRYEADTILKPYAEWYRNARELVGPPCVAKLQGLIKAMFNASLGYTAREKYDWVPWDCQIGHKYWLGTTTSPDDMQSSVSAQVLNGERRWLRVAGEPYEAMPFLHATICSYARIRLLEIFAAAGRGNVLYCDTDGVLVNKLGYALIEAELGIGSGRPGTLIERFVPGKARIQGQKSYSVGNNFIQAGVSKTTYSALVQKQVLTVSTGRVDGKGSVWPFEFRCERSGKAGRPWVNILK